MYTEAQYKLSGIADNKDHVWVYFGGRMRNIMDGEHIRCLDFQDGVRSMVDEGRIELNPLQHALKELEGVSIHEVNKQEVRQIIRKLHEDTA